MVKTTKKIVIENAREMLERDITDYGNSAKIIVPKKHRGRKATVIVEGD